MEQYDKNFLGRNGFLWFIGVVEDRMDPEYAGRVRVRCLGHHTSNNNLLPTSDLPWAQVVLPITSSGISGLGNTPLGLVEGSWVFGYFRDGDKRQEPLVLGSYQESQRSSQVLEDFMTQLVSIPNIKMNQMSTV